MSFFERTVELVGRNSALVMLILAAVVLVLAVVAAYLLARVRRFPRRWPADLSVERAEGLALAIGACREELKDLRELLKLLSTRLDQLAAQQTLCFQKMGFVRFDAFEDVGGEQSFSLALLDGNDRGVVLSSIYSRSDARLYAKQTQGSSASHTLSSEEEAALSQAMAAGRSVEG